MEQLTCFKYLGIYLDSGLTFAKHIDHVCKKTRQQTGILLKLRPCINTDISKHLYVTSISPLFEYCWQVYDRCFMSGTRKSQCAQNRILPAVLHREKQSDTTDLHCASNIAWLDVSTKITSCVKVDKLTY